MISIYIRIAIPLLLILTAPQLSGQYEFYNFSVKDINGNDFDFTQLTGKKVLIVNTASKCGLTPQYKGLEELYKKYGGDNFVIIAFPSNDFASQEPGTDEEIAVFCETKYGVTFPVMSKITVKGEGIHPVYEWLTTEALNGFEDSKVAWNFQKYLINEEGKLVGHVVPRKKPDHREIIEFLEN